jgi:hypothetical protein
MTERAPHNDDIRFDRLVDGELTPSEFQDLLAALDDEPGGWRRCALSFLEAQALEKELGLLRRESVEPAAPVTPSSTAASPAFRLGSQWSLLAMAASFLVAFALGMAIRYDWSPNDNSGAPQLAENEPSGPGSDHPLPLPAEKNGALARNNTPRSQQPLGNVTLVVDGNDTTPQQRVEVPVYNFDQVGQDYFTLDQSVLPPEMRELLERNGHELRRNRQLVPLQLGNGQQAVFPMEEVEIVPVRMPAF